MLGTDVVVTELERLAQRELEDLLRARREGDVPGRRLATVADDLLDLRAHRFERDPERLQRLGGDTLALVDEAEEDVLGTDVVVVEQARFFLRKNDHSAGPVGETFKHAETASRQSDLTPFHTVKGFAVQSLPVLHSERRRGPDVILSV